jgi:heme-degrading monooxygenase HmoA
MIVELAQVTVAPGQETAFDAAFAGGIQWAAGSPGYLGHELRRSIENPVRYVLRSDQNMKSMVALQRRPSKSLKIGHMT